MDDRSLQNNASSNIKTSTGKTVNSVEIIDLTLSPTLEKDSLQPCYGAIVASINDPAIRSFYEDLPYLNKETHIQQLKDKVTRVRDQQTVVNALHAQYEADITVKALKIKNDKKIWKKEAYNLARFAEISAEEEILNNERKANNHVKHWKHHLNRWVVAMSDVVGVWEDVFACFEDNLVCVIVNDDEEYNDEEDELTSRPIELYKHLEDARSRVAAARDKALSHGDAVTSLMDE